MPPPDWLGGPAYDEGVFDADPEEAPPPPIATEGTGPTEGVWTEGMPAVGTLPCPTGGVAIGGGAIGGVATDGVVIDGVPPTGVGTDGTVTEGTVTEGTVTEGTVTDGTVTEGTVTEGTLTEGTVTEGTLTEGTVTEGTLTDGTFSAPAEPELKASTGTMTAAASRKTATVRRASPGIERAPRRGGLEALIRVVLLLRVDREIIDVSSPHRFRPSRRM